MTYKDMELADLLATMREGEIAEMNGHKVALLPGRESEVYEVDGAEVCFIEAWDLVREETGNDG